MLESPGERRFRIGSITCQKTRAEMSDASKSSPLEQLPRVLHHGCPTIVESNKAENSGPSRDAFDFGCLCRILTDGFFTEDVLARIRGCAGQFQMPMVRSGDVDDLYLRVTNHLLQVRGVAFKAETLLRRLRARFDFIGANDEPRPDAAVRESIGSLKIGAAVCRSPPASSNHSSSHDLCHAEPCPLTLTQLIESNPQRIRISRDSEASRREPVRPDHDKRR